MNTKVLIALASMMISLGCTSKPSSSNLAAFGVAQPLGGTGIIFVSSVDGYAYGIMCPGNAQTYANTTADQATQCGYTKHYGPVSVSKLLASADAGFDPATLQNDLNSLKSSAIKPVLTTQDQHYNLWAWLITLASSDDPTAPFTPAPTGPTPPSDPVTEPCTCILTIASTVSNGTVTGADYYCSVKDGGNTEFPAGSAPTGSSQGSDCSSSCMDGLPSQCDAGSLTYDTRSTFTPG